MAACYDVTHWGTENAGMENAGLEIAGPNITGVENAGPPSVEHEMDKYKCIMSR